MSRPQPDDPSTRSDPPEDSLSALHRMSRTAGLGTQEYVAVNTAAVAALLLGLISAAAVASSVLLILPVAAIIVSVVAIVQVRRSGGTQAGVGLAAAGLVLALVFLLWVGGSVWMNRRAIRMERGQIVELIETISKKVTSGDYSGAYEHFGSNFRSQVSREAFLKGWADINELEGYGPIKGLRWNTILEVQIDPESGAKFANGMILVDTASGGQPDRWRGVFRKDPSRGWLIEDVESPFFVRTAPLREIDIPTPLLRRL